MAVQHIDTALAMFRHHISYCGPGVPYFSLRAYFYSAVRDRTGSDLNLDLFLQQLAESYKSHHHVEELRAIPQKWPTPQLVQHCVNHFSRTGLYSVFPIVDTAVLQELLNSGIMDNPTESTNTANRACLVAFTALVTEFCVQQVGISERQRNADAVQGLAAMAMTKSLNIISSCN